MPSDGSSGTPSRSQRCTAASGPTEFLALAWRRVIENSAHDSICGCSADEVSAQVLVRFAEAEELGRDLAAEALEPARAATPRGAAVVANPSPYVARRRRRARPSRSRRSGTTSRSRPPTARASPRRSCRGTRPQLIRVELLGRDIPELVQAAPARPRALRPLAERLRGRAGAAAGLRARHRPGPAVDRPRRAANGRARRGEGQGGRAVGDRVPHPCAPRLAARVSAPALGWTGVRAVEGSEPGDAVKLDGGVLENGLLRVEVANDGTLRIGDLEGVGRIVRGFDVGDSYNYAPPADDVLVDRPDSVTRRLARARSGARVGRRPADVRLAARTTSSRSRRTSSFEPASRSFGSASPSTTPPTISACGCTCRCGSTRSHSYAEGQYAVVERGLVAEGGHGEMPLPTFPASSFVSAGGVALLLEHVSEYELLEGRELALTVLRSTGWISRNTNPYREEPAGPELRDSRRPDARSPLVLVRDLPARRRGARPGRPRAGRALPASVPHRGRRGRRRASSRKPRGSRSKEMASS